MPLAGLDWRGYKNYQQTGLKQNNDIIRYKSHTVLNSLQDEKCYRFMLAYIIQCPLLVYHKRTN